MKKILILNGSPKKNGNTAKLINAFREGAEGAGHEVREFYLQGMNIHGCLDCQGCRNAKEEADNPCVQKDGMAEIYGAFPSSDVLVFASPVYFWTIDGQLKTAIDRLYAYVMWGRAGKKETALLLTAGGDDERQYAKILDWYRGFERYMNWKSLGNVLGAEKVREAKELGASIESI